jgi:type IV pilus assembly protein PilF
MSRKLGYSLSENESVSCPFPELRHSLVFLFLFFVLLSCATLSQEETLKEAQSHYTLAISSMNEGNFQPAFVELQKAIQLNPNDDRAYYALGLIYHYFDDFTKSEESFLKAIELDPSYSEAYNSLGVVYTKMEKWEEAERALSKALENQLYTSPEKAFANLGKVYYRMGDFEKALTAYKKAIKRSPDFSSAFYGLALTYNSLRRYGDASESLTEAIELDPLFKGDKDKAEEQFTRRKLKSLDSHEEQDYHDFLDILHY